MRESRKRSVKLNEKKNIMCAKNKFKYRIYTLLIIYFSRPINTFLSGTFSSNDHTTRVWKINKCVCEASTTASTYDLMIIKLSTGRKDFSYSSSERGSK